MAGGRGAGMAERAGWALSLNFVAHRLGGCELCHCRKLAKSDKARAAASFCLTRQFVISNSRTSGCLKCLWNSTATQRLKERQREGEGGSKSVNGQRLWPVVCQANKPSSSSRLCMAIGMRHSRHTATVAAAKYVYGYIHSGCC